MNREAVPVGTAEPLESGVTTWSNSGGDGARRQLGQASSEIFSQLRFMSAMGRKLPLADLVGSGRLTAA